MKAESGQDIFDLMQVKIMILQILWHVTDITMLHLSFGN